MKVKLLFILLMTTSLLAFAQEYGNNDFRISDMGPNGNTNYFSFSPKVSYSETSQKYLVVWHADDDTGALVDNEFEIYGQFIDNNGNEIGTNDFRISFTATDGNTAFRAEDASLTWNSVDDEFLVVWRSDTTVDNELEIYGQLIDANTGALIGNNFRISDIGAEGDTSFGAFLPEVAHSATSNEYLVVWEGDDTLNNKFEIYGQRVSNLGIEIGVNDFQISSQLPLNDAAFDARNPAIAWNSINNDYLIIWEGETTTDNEKEIFAQLYDLDTQSLLNSNTQISDMGPDMDTSYSASNAKLAFNSTNNEYTVIWNGTDLVPNQFEIYGQRLSNTLAELGTNDFRITTITNVDSSYDAWAPDISWNSSNNEFFIVYRGDGTSTNDDEIYGHKIDNSGSSITSSFVLSDMGGNGDSTYRSNDPSISTNNSNGYLACWYGDDNVAPLVDNENEIFIQMYGNATLGINESILNKFNVFPNPVDDKLIIHGDTSKITSVQIYNILGKKVKHIKATFSNIDVNDLKSGVYFLKITKENDASVQTIKLIKK